MKRKTTLEDYGFTTTKCPKIVYEISDLPNEMLREIFKNLSTKDRLIARRVSNFWMELLNKYFQDDNTLKLTGDMDLSPTGSLYQTFEARLASTKAKRKFSRLMILRWREEKLGDLISFVKLIGDEIRFLKMENSVRKLYDNLPNLESLEVDDDEFLDDLTFPPKLKKIKIGSWLTELHKLPDILKIASLQHFSAKFIYINRNFDALVPFLDPKLKLLLDDIFGNDAVNPDNAHIMFHSEFNYCGDKKCKTSDITRVRIFRKILNIAPLAEFDNLKRLQLLTNDENAVKDFASSHQNMRFPSVNNLKMIGPINSQISLKLVDKFLQKFPNLEHLCLTVFKLTDGDFRVVCQHMPKLKSLSLGISEISILTLFDLLDFSLKDLKSLELLSVATKPEILNSPQLTWPSLPNLKSVNLQGEGFRCLTQCFFTQIVERSPRIENFGINYNRDLVEYQHSKFLPLLKRLNLKDLNLPGDGDAVTQNTELVEYVVAICKKLECFTIYDDNGFSMTQENYLFKRLPKLKKLSSKIMNNYCPFRVTERSNGELIRKIFD